MTKRKDCRHSDVTRGNWSPAEGNKTTENIQRRIEKFTRKISKTKTGKRIKWNREEWKKKIEIRE